MKTRTWMPLVILLMMAVALSACSAKNSPSEIVKKQLTSGTWAAAMSEGTTARYTFTKDGNFTCETSVTAGDQEAQLSREGTYEVVESGDAVGVFLRYPKSTYVVEITCTRNGDWYDFVIAGCPMNQE